MLCILIKKWQSHPKFKSGQNLSSEIYPEREKTKQKRKDWEDEETNIKSEGRQMGGGVSFVSGYLEIERYFPKDSKRKHFFKLL